MIKLQNQDESVSMRSAYVERFGIEMDLKGKKVLIVGAGISGIGAAEVLCRVGAEPVLYDEKAAEEEIKKKLPVSCVCKIVTGSLPEEIKAETELAVFSPGVPVDTPFADSLRERGIVSGAKLNSPMFSEKEGLLRLPERTVRQRQLLWQAKS